MDNFGIRAVNHNSPIDIIQLVGQSVHGFSGVKCLDTTGERHATGSVDTASPTHVLDRLVLQDRWHYVLLDTFLKKSNIFVDQQLRISYNWTKYENFNIKYDSNGKTNKFNV